MSHSAAGAADAVRAHGGSPGAELGLVDGVVAAVPSGSVDELEADPRVHSVTGDYDLRVQSEDFGGEPSSTYPQSAGAAALWSAGVTGSGVGVGLLDTGIADHPDLAGRVVASADITREGTFSDSYGHGTFVAGVIAGDGTQSSGRFTGVAPGAHLMSVKVAGADGATTLGQVLYGLQLIDASKDLYGIRVVVVALAGRPHPGPDPLVVAIQRLWADGLVVVTAAGNSGPEAGSVATPAIDPYSIAAGATNDFKTASRSDDEVAGWSARGPSAYGLPKPDVVAPGTSLVSLRAEGSTIDAAHQSARVGDSYFRGSGTSMSAAVTAGAAALVLDARPGLGPDDVKGKLLGSAVPVSGADRNAAGAGSIDAAGAAASDAPAANGDLPPLPSGRAAPPRDPFGDSHEPSFGWHPSPVGGDRWLGRAWAGRAWAGRAWAGRAWADAEWSGRAWAAADWQ